METIISIKNNNEKLKKILVIGFFLFCISIYLILGK